MKSTLSDDYAEASKLYRSYFPFIVIRCNPDYIHRQALEANPHRARRIAAQLWADVWAMQVHSQICLKSASNLPD